VVLRKSRYVCGTLAPRWGAIQVPIKKIIENGDGINKKSKEACSISADCKFKFGTT
jgi:hypothetical protein